MVFEIWSVKSTELIKKGFTDGKTFFIFRNEWKACFQIACKEINSKSVLILIGKNYFSIFSETTFSDYLVEIDCAGKAMPNNSTFTAEKFLPHQNTSLYIS